MLKFKIKAFLSRPVMGRVKGLGPGFKTMILQYLS